MTATGSSARDGTLARWSWLGTTCGLAAALVIGAWVNYRGVRSAADSLDRGQAELLESGIRELSYLGGFDVTAASLDSFVSRHASYGLRYAAIFDSDGAVTVSAGHPVGPLTRDAVPSPGDGLEQPLTRVGPVLRAFFLGPPIRSALERTPSEPGPPGGRTQLELPAPVLAVIEFQPVAQGLAARAQRTLLLASAGAVILTLAALLSWRTSRRYDAARRRLEEQRRLASLGEMSAVLAHEIRNPLASLKGNAQLLSERLADSSPERRKADHVVDGAVRLEALVTDLLDFARSGPLDVRSVDPAALLRSVAGELPEARIVIDDARAPDRWLLDEHRFAHAVLENLLRNAVQASPRGASVYARVYVERGRLVFTVRDLGPGVPKGGEERIFDPFFTTRITGTGLGLAVARRMVELHGGRVVAANEGGIGALFRVEVPPTNG